MIQLNPIHPAIQKTLQEKIKISGKEENSSKQSILDSKRSVWAKMISLSVPSKSLINPNKSLFAFATSKISCKSIIICFSNCFI